jgi:NAD(P)-dependent dehydrogenase (short-subunit alcohol dehydrogenase family)
MSIAGAMLKQLVQCTALEGANFNVRVNGVAAGVTATKAREKKESTLTPGKELRENQMILK